MNVIRYPGCKINLGLRVIERRNDGFHNLESLFVFVPDIADILEIAESKTQSSLTLFGDTLDCGTQDNLVMQSYRLLASAFDIPEVEMYLYKKIPSGAGLGGGSSDAAMTLIILNNMFDLGLTKERLATYALKLGSDCPFFVHAQLDAGSKNIATGSVDGVYSGRAMLAGGRGDILTPNKILQLEGRTIKIEIPPVHISTVEAYRGVVPALPAVPLKQLLEQPIEEWRNIIINDFEKHILKKYPIIEEYKNRMYEQGAVYASMSGSGSAVFGIF